MTEYKMVSIVHPSVTPKVDWYGYCGGLPYLCLSDGMIHYFLPIFLALYRISFRLFFLFLFLYQSSIMTSLLLLFPYVLPLLLLSILAYAILLLVGLRHIFEPLLTLSADFHTLYPSS
jgi:hypothetical protein